MLVTNTKSSGRSFKKKRDTCTHSKYFHQNICYSGGFNLWPQNFLILFPLGGRAWILPPLNVWAELSDLLLNNRMRKREKVIFTVDKHRHTLTKWSRLTLPVISPVDIIYLLIHAECKGYFSVEFFPKI